MYYIWHNDFDTWYGYNHWIVARDADECVLILSSALGISVGRIRTWGCNWYRKTGIVAGPARYLGNFNRRPFVEPALPKPKVAWRKEGF